MKCGWRTAGEVRLVFCYDVSVVEVSIGEIKES